MLKHSKKNKKAIFVCQITESHFKAIKYLPNNSQGEFVGVEFQALPLHIDNQKLSEKIKQIFAKLEYNNNPVIVSLPRSNATCRYLKIPSLLPEEIERIASLQALHYLPYPANELISGYQIVQSDKEGYSDINLVIAHKNIIERYIKIFKEIKAAGITIVLSSYGLCNFYSSMREKDSAAAMLIDIDYNQVELAVVSNKKLYFSRSFKLEQNQPDWENLFIGQVNKSRDAYLKELPKETLRKIIIFGRNGAPTGLKPGVPDGAESRLPTILSGRRDKISPELLEALNKRLALPVELLSYSAQIKLSANALNSISAADNSFVSLIGLALEKPEESLNLLPQDIKERAKKIARRKVGLRITLFISAIIAIWSLAVTKNLDNKVKYLQRIKIEINKIAKEAKPLEEIEKRANLIQGRLRGKPTSLELLYDLYQTIPERISLVNFSYEEDKQVILRGQTPELNSVFAFVDKLEKSAVFKKFNIKVRYATQKKTQTGEVVDFEVVCLKK